MSGFRFVEDHQADYRITDLCRVAGVSRSGFYAWRSRRPSDRQRSNDALLVKIRESLQAPIHFEGHELSTSASIGVVLYPDDGRDFETLLKKADTAMYRAKEAGRNQYRFFDEQMNIEAVEHLRIKSGLRRALRAPGRASTGAG